MVFTEAVRSRLLSRLRPWLEEEPEMELKLGLLSSNGSARNLCLDPSALNPLIEEPTSLVFKQVKIGELSVRFSPWKSPSIVVEVRGVHVTLTPRELPDNGKFSRDSDARKRKEVMASVDPEGSSVHEIIEGLLHRTSSGNRFMVSLSNAILGSSLIIFHDIHLQLQFIDESLACLFELNRLAVEPRPHCTSLFKRSICLSLLLGKESTLDVSCSSLVLKTKENVHLNTITSLIGLTTTVRLYNLQPLVYAIQVSCVEFKLSPLDIPLLLIMADVLSAKESGCLRNGQELWKLTKQRLGHLTLCPVISLHKVVNSVVLWLRYLSAYESLLLLIRYSAEWILEENVAKISRDTKLVTCLKRKLRSVYELEEKLPAEAVARARRIARHRMLSSSCATSLKSRTSMVTSLLWKLLAPVFLIWELVKSVSFYIACFFPMRSTLRTHQGGMYTSTSLLFDGVPNYSSENLHLSLNLRELHIILSPAVADHSAINGEGKHASKTLPMRLPSFRFGMRCLYLTWTRGITSKSFFMAFGELKLCLSSSSWDSQTEKESGLIMWSDPAFFRPLERNVSNSSNSSKDASISFLETSMKELWSNWMKITRKCEEKDNQLMKQPFFVWEFRSFLRNPYLSGGGCGLWKCSFQLGKLNFDLMNSSIMSAIWLSGQMQYFYHLTSGFKRNQGTSCSSSMANVDGESKVEGLLETHINRMNVAMFNVIPDKSVHVGALIAGFSVRLSPQGAWSSGPTQQDNNPIVHQRNGNYCFTFDVEEIEFAMLPVSKTVLATLTGESSFNEAEADYLWSKEPPLVELPKAHANEKFVSQSRVAFDACLRFNSLTVSFVDLKVDRRYHVVGPLSLALTTSICSDCLHSLSSTVNCMSMVLSGTARGLAVSLYMDELGIFLQLLKDVLSLASCIDGGFDDISVGYTQDSLRKLSTSLKKYMRKNMLKPEAYNKPKTLMIQHVLVDVAFEFESMDILLNNSRDFTKNPTKSNWASDTAAMLLSMQPMYKEKSTLGIIDPLGPCLGVFINKPSIQLSMGELPLKLLGDVSGIQAIIVTHQNQTGSCSDVAVIKDLLHQSSSNLCKFSLSSCLFTIHVGSCTHVLPVADGSNLINGSGSGYHKTSRSANGSHSCGEGLKDGTLVPNEIMATGQCPTIHTPKASSDCWILVDFILGEILVAEYCVKDQARTGNHGPTKLKLLVSVNEEYTISCKIEDGYVFLETSALTLFIRCLKMYFVLMRNLQSFLLSDAKKSSGNSGNLMASEETLDKFTNHPSGDHATDTIIPSSYMKTKWEVFNLSVDLAQITVSLAVTNGSGGTQELIIEADISLKFSYGRSLLFDLSRLTIFTRGPHKYKLRTDDSLHFHSKSFGSSSHSTSENPSLHFVHGINNIEYFTYPPDFQREILAEGGLSKISSSYCVRYILKHAVAFIKTEKPLFTRETGCMQLNCDWVGNGSISGLDLTITLSEIQMLLALVSPFSEISNVNSGNDMKQNIGSRNQRYTDNSENTIPDGAIVAIKDLHQHIYFAAESVNGKFRPVGALHYSLVGGRALFRVCYHERWWSGVPLFSLISLYAKNDKGIPLRLNCIRGSGFVELSSRDDKDCALWKTFPYKTDKFEDDDDDDVYKVYGRKAFHLVNHKNGCGVAFVDGLPEFIKKPGNLFKAKVFDKLSLPNDVERLVISMNYTGESFDETIQGESGDGEVLCLDSNLPYVKITIDKVIVTILDEISDANDKIPLIRSSVNDIHVIGQILTSKHRIMCSFKFAVHYFDSQRSLWREILSPIDSHFFFRFKSTNQSLVNMGRGVPVCFYFEMRQVDISLTELSLDILLYLAGKLDIAGPYAVRSSVIFANCCKVENNSGLTLHCQFADNQDTVIAQRQSASILLRRVALADHLPESDNLVSIFLAEDGVYSTSPINIPLSNALILAWRTRVVSLHDSRSFPGPLVVVEVSKNTEEGLSLVVSPMLRIHNESGLPIELCFRRPQESESESASVLLKKGETIDDSMTGFDALTLSGGSKRTLMSLALGNFLLSIRPQITDCTGNNGELLTVKWSEDLKGGKAVRIAGIFDKLNYKLRKAFGVGSLKSSVSTICFPLATEDRDASAVHFLIQTIGRDVPVTQPPKSRDAADAPPVALQVQKEIFIYPTFQIYNLLQSEILILLTENHPDICKAEDCYNIGKRAIIPCGSSVYLYANPAMINFTIMLTAYNSECKLVGSRDWVNNLDRQKNETHYLDIELSFGGGKYFASLRLSRADRGIIEAVIFTSYTFQNNTEVALYCASPNQKPIPWSEIEKYGFSLPPELGCLLPPKSTRSWFLKSNKVQLKWLEEQASETLLDLNSLSGFTELCLEARDDVGGKHIRKLGVALLPHIHKLFVPSQLVSIVPRFIVSNESMECILIRQCYLEGGADGDIYLEGNQRTALQFMSYNGSKRREASFFDLIVKRHKSASEDSLIFIQFCIRDTGYSWSGPVCVSSLGRFFLKFKKPPATPASQGSTTTGQEDKSIKFAVVHIVEESASLVLHFSMPPDIAVPYRIENCLRGTSIVYHQKDSLESDLLGPGGSVEYVWDDLNLPHKLVVRIVDLHLLREINIKKVCTWKTLFKMRQNKGLILHSPLDRSFGVEKRAFDNMHSLEVFKVGYEVYADGLTRVLRICESVDSYKEEKMLQPCANIQFRVSNFAMHIIENDKQDEGANEPPICCTIIVARLANISVDSLITEQYKYNSLKIQSFSVDEKWQGAPFASMVRRSQLQDSCLTENVLSVNFVLQSTQSNVKQVKFFSIILQPIDLKVDEETLMRLVPFWRTSLSNSRTQSQKFYFKHFEIHPIKITASFLPEKPRTTYSSAQETLRSLLHIVIKVPAIKNRVVELNGVLLTHALVTFRELLVKCAQHYSWYAIRAIYIAKGSQLLPPAFSSLFDDTAASSLDVFFDPSGGSINLPGLTLNMFKFIHRCIDSKGFSGTKRYFGDLGKTIKAAGSNVLFAAITEISDNVLRGAEASGFNGMVNGFHQGILRLAMEPSLLGAAVMEGGPDRKIKLDHSPGVDELYIEGYLQAMLDVMYKQEYLRVRVIDNQVVLKNLPPNSSVIYEIMENVKSFLVSKALLKGDASTAARPLRHLRSDSEWRIGPTVLTLCEHLFVSFAIRMLRKEADKCLAGIRWKREIEDGDKHDASSELSQEKPNRKWAVGKFVVGGMIAYVDGRLCRHIPNAIARRIVSGFLLSFLDKKDG